MTEKILPIVKSIILCEDVLPGPAGTENVHLMNVFQDIRPRSQQAFPYRFPQLCVFLQLTDGEGEAPVHVTVRKADSDLALFGSSRHPIQLEHRLQVKWAVFRLQDCRFPEPGLYLIEVFYDDQWIADQILRLFG